MLMTEALNDGRLLQQVCAPRLCSMAHRSGRVAGLSLQAERDDGSTVNTGSHTHSTMCCIGAARNVATYCSGRYRFLYFQDTSKNPAQVWIGLHWNEPVIGRSCRYVTSKSGFPNQGTK